jgi:hypothetical protein
LVRIFRGDRYSDDAVVLGVDIITDYRKEFGY